MESTVFTILLLISVSRLNIAMEHISSGFWIIVTGLETYIPQSIAQLIYLIITFHSLVLLGLVKVGTHIASRNRVAIKIVNREKLSQNILLKVT